MEFIILFDNYSRYDYLQALWGFSLYIPKFKLLFDTGSNGRVLLQNAQKMGVDLKEARYLFLSHPHWDHIGGLDSVLEINPNLTLFLPDSFSPRLIKDLHRFASNVVVLNKEPKELLSAVYSTGTMGIEQALVLDTPKGAVVVAGCSHFGIEALISRVQEITSKKLHYLIGGLHLFEKGPEEIVSVAKALVDQIDCITPTHCSGEVAMEIFAMFFGKGYKRGGVGEVIRC